MRKETAVSFILAFGVVYGATWIAGQSMPPISVSIRSAAPSVSTELKNAPLDSDFPERPARALPSTPSLAESSDRGISKCVTNGKTIYSDQGCPTGFAVKTVALHDSDGIVSPPKDALQELAAKRQAKKKEYERLAQVQLPVQQINVPAQDSESECDWLKKRIQGLESMARQPQSGQTQDWIKQEKAKAQSRQFELHC